MASQRGQEQFTKLVSYLEKARSIESAIQLCEWDQETYMPSEGIHFRSLAVSSLVEILHKMMTSSTYKKLLGALIDLNSGQIVRSDLTEKQILNVKVLKEDLDKQIKLPTKFVQNFAKLTSESTYVWQKAKAHSDFKSFEPYLEKIVKANQKKAELLGYKKHPYDALLDLYEPGMTTEVLDELFTNLKFKLIDLLRAIKAKNKKPSPIDLRSSMHHQMQLGRNIMEYLGLNKEFSRLDITVHPFCSTLGPHDIRLTTKIHDENFISSLYSVLHEAGHGLYGNGVSKHALGLPESSSASLGIDESQSRLYETVLGKSRPFLESIFPLIKESLHLPNLNFEHLYEHVNHVDSSLIRIESDEVSYCLHIILRYEMEKALIEGSLKVKNIPKVWNEKMESYLGIIPKMDSAGCLQDIHWSMGSFGYFPTYALGNIYAAATIASYRKQNPNFDEDIRNGNLKPLQEFLKQKIYDHGKLLKPIQIIKGISGNGLDEKPYINYLKDKYSKLYALHDLAP